MAGPGSTQVSDVLSFFSIDSDSRLPPFMQLHDTVIASIASGKLRPGQKLPTVRALAEHLGIATNTVASAYRSLEAAGVAEGKGRAGTFVVLADDPIEASAQRIAATAVTEISSLGISADRLRAIMNDAIEITFAG